MCCRLGFDEIKSASELCTAAAQGKVDLIKHYIKAGINVNAADYDKRTALHIAAADGCLEAVRRMSTSPSHGPSNPRQCERRLRTALPNTPTLWPVVPSRLTMGSSLFLHGKVGQRPLCHTA